MKTLLVTGGFGFLGRNVAKRFQSEGYRVVGLGHGRWEELDLARFGFEKWVEADVSLNSLESLRIKPDVIFHAGGSGSVAHSFAEPYLDFQKSVQSTASVLEWMRTHSPQSLLIYPSSPAVHGVHAEVPIHVGDALDPVSPYGAHKLMAENLCAVYRKNFALKISVIRFFSIYGEGLKKQLLWDACNRFLSSESRIEFWGDGQDVRDWIHVDDAVELILKSTRTSSVISTLNGGSGVGHRVSEVLQELKNCFKSTQDICFKGERKQGDPYYYVADLTEAKTLQWSPQISLHEGLKRYVQWFLREHHS